jgi:hypothetical protein
MTALHPNLLGQLYIVQSDTPTLVSSRPLANAALLRRVCAGRASAELPGLLGRLFALCGEQHALTAARALAAAQGAWRSNEQQAREQAYVHASCLRDHALHLLRTSNHGVLDASLLRALPALPNPRHVSDGDVQALREFTLTHVLGTRLSAFSERYGRVSSDSLASWAREARDENRVARWLDQVGTRARHLAVSLPTRTLADAPEPQLRRLIHAAQADDRFAEHAALPTHVHPRASELLEPSLQTLESGAFHRAAWAQSVLHVFDMLAARIAELAQLCDAQPPDAKPLLRAGALQLAPGEAVAYTEIARGLLVHYVKLDTRTPAQTQVSDYRVFTPSDFCLHPDGALARALHNPCLTRADMQLLLAAFDPCVEVAFCRHADLPRQLTSGPARA